MCHVMCHQTAKPHSTSWGGILTKDLRSKMAEKTKKGQVRGSRADLEHELAHGFELICGVVLPMKQRVVGHLPQLHHHIAQLALCREEA